MKDDIERQRSEWEELGDAMGGEYLTRKEFAILFSRDKDALKRMGLATVDELLRLISVTGDERLPMREVHAFRRSLEESMREKELLEEEVTRAAKPDLDAALVQVRQCPLLLPPLRAFLTTHHKKISIQGTNAPSFTSKIPNLKPSTLNSRHCGLQTVVDGCLKRSLGESESKIMEAIDRVEKASASRFRPGAKGGRGGKGGGALSQQAKSPTSPTSDGAHGSGYIIRPHGSP